MFNDDVIKKAMEVEIFSAHINAEETEKIWKNQRDEIADLAAQIHNSGCKRILFSASGASYCMLFSGKYLLSKYSMLDVYFSQGPELISQAPKKIENDTFAIIASYSGKTEDTLDVLDFLNENNIPNLAIVKDSNSPVGKKADQTLSYGSKSLYIAPMFQLNLLCLELMKLRGECSETDMILSDLERIPEIIASINEDCKKEAQQIAEKYSKENLIYVLGSGPLYGLAYQMAVTIITEYLRIDSSVINPVEFRHGPLEIVRKDHPALAFLIGNDNSRIYVERTLNFCKKYGAKTISWDVKKYTSVHSLLSPFVLHTPTQWFVLYSSILKNIDLDEYLYMHMVPYYNKED